MRGVRGSFGVPGGWLAGRDHAEGHGQKCAPRAHFEDHPAGDSLGKRLTLSVPVSWRPAWGEGGAGGTY